MTDILKDSMQKQYKGKFLNERIQRLQSAYASNLDRHTKESPSKGSCQQCCENSFEKRVLVVNSVVNSVVKSYRHEKPSIFPCNADKC